MLNSKPRHSIPPLGLESICMTLGQSHSLGTTPPPKKKCCYGENRRRKHYVHHLELYKIKLRYRPNLKKHILPSTNALFS